LPTTLDKPPNKAAFLFIPSSKLLAILVIKRITEFT
jgi:hypothetical protein